MKRFILSLALALVCVTGFAQLNYTAAPNSVKVWTIIGGSTGVKYFGGEYSLYLTTDNQYDNFIYIDLGKTKAQALVTLGDLKKLLDDFPKGQDIKLEQGTRCTLSRKGPHAAYVYSPDRAGMSLLERVTVNAAIRGVEAFTPTWKEDE